MRSLKPASAKRKCEARAGLQEPCLQRENVATTKHETHEKTLNKKMMTTVCLPLEFLHGLCLLSIFYGTEGYFNQLDVNF